MKQIVQFSLFLAVLLSLGSCKDKEEINNGGGGNGGGEIPSGYTSIMDYASYKTGEDWAPAFAKAFTEKSKVYVPGGTYKSSRIAINSGKSILGAGNSTVFVPMETRLFSVAGSVGSEVAIASDIADFSSSILLAGTSNFMAGDEILIRGQRNCMRREGTSGVNYDPDWVLGRTRETSCFFAEMDVVTTASGSRITTASPRIFPHYYKDNTREPSPSLLGDGTIIRQGTTVSLLSMVKNVTLSNFAVTGTAQCFQPFYFTYAKDCLVEKITYSTSVEATNSDGNPSISTFYGLYSWNLKFSDCEAILSAGLLASIDAKAKTYDIFSKYNIFRMISCYKSGFENCRANGGSHAINIDRSAPNTGQGGIPSVDCYIKNCTVVNGIWAGITVQQACYRTELSGNTVSGSCSQGVITAGRDTRILNNTVSTTRPYETDHYYAHISRGGTFGIGMNEGYACGTEVRGNIITGFYTGITVLDGYEDKNCFEEGNMVISDNTVTDCLRGFNIYKNSYCAAMGRKDLGIEVSGNTFTRTGPLTVIVNTSNTNTRGAHLPAVTAGVSILDNIFRSYHFGVWMEPDVDYIEIKRNSFIGCNFGMSLRNLDTAPSYLTHISQSGNICTDVATESSGLSQSFIRTY